MGLNLLLTGLCPATRSAAAGRTPVFQDGVEGHKYKMAYSLPGCEALPPGRTPAFQGGELHFVALPFFVLNRAERYSISYPRKAVPRGGSDI